VGGATKPSNLCRSGLARRLARAQGSATVYSPQLADSQLPQTT